MAPNATYVLNLPKLSLMMMCYLSVITTSALVCSGCAETSIESEAISDKSNDAELSRRLDQVGTLEVVECFALIEVTVLSAGRASGLLRALNSLGSGITRANTAIKLSLDGWITRAIASAGVTIDTKAITGLTTLFIILADRMGIDFTVDQIAVDTFLLISDYALGLLNSCSLVAQTYWDGFKSLPYLFGYEPDVNGCLDHDGWVECQRTCGVSVSESEQLNLWSIPNECRFEPVQTNLRQAYINGYLRHCLNRMCVRGSSAPASFNSCTWEGSAQERELITGWPPLEQRCQEAYNVSYYLGEDMQSSSGVNIPDNNQSGGSGGSGSGQGNNGSGNVDSTPINSCVELFGCERSCNRDQSCVNACYERVTNTTAISQATQLMLCMSSNQCADDLCLERYCATEYSACGFELTQRVDPPGGNTGGSSGGTPTDPPSGGSDQAGSGGSDPGGSGSGGSSGGSSGGNSGSSGLSCGEVWDCLIECPDQSCEDACIGLGTAQAQSDVNALLNCYVINEFLINDYADLYTYCEEETLSCF